jgi:co-chaperonin GroES (HSP10)
VVALGKYSTCAFEVKVGDRIIFPTEDSMTITKNNKKYKIVKYVNVLAIKEEAA